MRVGVPGAGLGAEDADWLQLSSRQRAGGRLDEVDERVRSAEAWWARCCCGEGLSLEADGWMEWTRSANQAFTISLWKPEGELRIIRIRIDDIQRAPHVK